MPEGRTLAIHLSMCPRRDSCDTERGFYSYQSSLFVAFSDYRQSIMYSEVSTSADVYGCLINLLLLSVLVDLLRADLYSVDMM